MSEFDLDDALNELSDDLGDEGDMDAAGDDMGGDMDLGDMDGGGDDAGSGGEAEDMDFGDLADAPPPPAAPARAPAPAAPKAGSLSSDEKSNLEFLLDIKLNITFEVGRSKMLVSDLLTLGQGSVIELHRLVGDELDLLINGKLVAKGEVVVVNEKFGCRISSIVPPEDRIKHMAGL